MKQRTRIILAVSAIIILVGIIFIVDVVQRKQSPAPEAGSIPVYENGKLTGYLLPSALQALDMDSFTDSEQGKLQEGWHLRDALILVIDVENLSPDTVISVSSSSRGKSVDVRWEDVANADNKVLLDLSNRGTFKLVSEKLPHLAVRDEWVQDVDKIEVKP
jgi:hypothetical protein